MKFVCLNCEKYMAFQKVEAPDEGRLGITFRCETCGARFSMVTNPGETQLVSSLGVSLGGRTVPLSPLEMTRGTLKGEPAVENAPAPSAVAATAAHGEGGAATAGAQATQGTGGCPFSATLREMGIGGGAQPSEAAPPVEPTWTEAAREQLAKLPGSVRYVLTRSVEDYARKQGYPTITPDVIAASKRGATSVDWAPEATSRLQNIPDFVRPMARREIERLARERGATTVTADVMDQAKDLFGRIGYSG